MPALACSIAFWRSRAAVSGSDASLRSASWSVEQRADELLLGAVVEVAGDLLPGRVGRLDHPPAPGAQRVRPRLRDVALARDPRRLELVLDVGERGHGAEAVGQVERRRRVGDRQDRAVLADEPVLALLVRLAGVPRAGDRAVLLRERRAVRILVVDRVVARPALELREVLVAERVERRRVGVVEAAPAVDDPDRLRDLGEDRVALAQRLLGLALRGHVDERRHDAPAVREVDRDGAHPDREHRPVAADEPVLLHDDGTARLDRVDDRALLGRDTATRPGACSGSSRALCGRGAPTRRRSRARARPPDWRGRGIRRDRRPTPAGRRDRGSPAAKRPTDQVRRRVRSRVNSRCSCSAPASGAQSTVAARRFRRPGAAAYSGTSQTTPSGGSVELGRERLAVPRHVLGVDAAEVADARAAVDVGVGVERLAPAARRAAGRSGSRGAAPARGCRRRRAPARRPRTARRNDDDVVRRRRWARASEAGRPSKSMLPQRAARPCRRG